MLTRGMIDSRTWSLLGGFDLLRRSRYALPVSKRVRKTVMIPEDLAAAAKAAGKSLGEYIEMHMARRPSERVATVASVYRVFALLEMARMPVVPHYVEIVHGTFGAEAAETFQGIIASGQAHALPVAAAQLLGEDDRRVAVAAVLKACQLARVPHEGFIEASRLLEASILR